MGNLPKLIMAAGAVIFAVGLLMNFVNLGRLPGDVFFKKGNVSFYFPVMTSILVSIVLSVILYVISRFR